MKFFVIFVIFMFAQSQTSWANPLNTDEELRGYIKKFRFSPIDEIKEKNDQLYQLGEKLFSDNTLSGNNNISCQTCHAPSLGTTDALPLSLGQGASGIGTKRIALNSRQIIPRNSTDLFNKGHPDITKLFWDARVSFDPDTNEYETPESALNGQAPEREDITQVLDGALSAQVLFPLLSHDEMRGWPGENPIADASTNLEAWDLILEKVLEKYEYQQLFKKAYKNDGHYNIGHIGRALAEFIRHRFQVTKTPWDQYLRGDNKAMSEKEKQGALVFITSGRCILCHNGSHFTNETSQNVAAPQVGPGKDIFHNDEGRFLITKREKDRYKFKVPPLRNIAKTAPYFHSGAYTTLEQVIEHYEKGVNALDDYDSMMISDIYRSNYVENLFVETNHYRIFRKKEGAHPALRSRLIKLNLEQKENLLYFLKYSLTED